MLLKCVPAVSPRLVDKSEADFNFCLWQVLRYLGCKRKYHWDRKLNFEIIISLEHSQGINNKYKPRIKMQIIHWFWQSVKNRLYEARAARKKAVLIPLIPPKLSLS